MNVGTQLQALKIRSTRSKLTIHRKRLKTDLNRVVHVLKLQFERLETSNLNVSPISLGTMTWGFQNTPDEAKPRMDYAIKDRYVNLLDTTESYPFQMKKYPPDTSELIVCDFRL